MNNNSTSLLDLLFQPGGLRRNRVVGCVLTCCLLTILAGCASEGMVKNVSPVSTIAPISQDLAVVETTSSVGKGVKPRVARSPNAPAETISMGDAEQRKLLNAMIISGLQETRKFGHVSGDTNAISSDSGIKVHADIKEITIVTDGSRAFLGALAGRGRILIQVTVSDLKSGNKIEVFEAEGKSSAGTAFAGTTDQAVQLAAEQTVAEVVKICKE